MSAAGFLVKRGVDGVEILAVELILGDAKGIANTVNMKQKFTFEEVFPKDNRFFHP